MPDQNDNQSPSQPPTAAQNPLPVPPSNSVLQDAAGGLKETIKDLWSKYSIFFIVVGVALLVAKFSSVLMDLLGYLSKREVEQAQKTDAVLKAQEDSANQQADALVKHAQELPSQQGKVTSDWNKKK